MHFSVTFAARYTMPKVLIASAFAQAEINPDLLKPYWAKYILTLIKAAHQSKRQVKKSRAKRKKPVSMGGLHMLTRLAYFALGETDKLLVAVEADNTIPLQTEAYSRKIDHLQAENEWKRRRESVETEEVMPKKKMRGQLNGEPHKHDDQSEESSDKERGGDLSKHSDQEQQENNPSLSPPQPSPLHQVRPEFFCTTCNHGQRNSNERSGRFTSRNA